MSRRSSTSSISLPALPPSPLRHASAALAALLGASAAGRLYIAFPFPTTVPLFVGLLTGGAAWAVCEWVGILVGLLRREEGEGEGYRVLWNGEERAAEAKGRGGRGRRVGLVLVTVLVLGLCCLGVRPPRARTLVTGHWTDASTNITTAIATNGFPTNATANASPTTPRTEKVFIAANLYNVEEIWEVWSSQLLELSEYLGPSNIFISIYESNSHDTTPALLSTLRTTLTHLSIPHRIICDSTTTRHWPHKASAERIAYLASARNKALEPLASPDETVRLREVEEWARGRVVFLNDVVFDAASVVELLDSELPREGEDGAAEDDGYDLVCGMDFGWSGVYDTWAARDVCASPLRPFWPYVKDPVSVERMRKEQVLEVGACWNGVVAFRADLVTFRPEAEGTAVDQSTAVEGLEMDAGGMRKRGWQMIDNATEPTSRHSPPLQLPLVFRTSQLEACDHSECFLFSYDLHRLYPTRDRPPRIWMNPRVKVAYEKRWWVWHNVVLEIPVIKFWLNHWSRGYPLDLVDWVWEYAGRRRDYCTWAAMAATAPARCPPLPGAVDRKWDQG